MKNYFNLMSLFTLLFVFVSCQNSIINGDIEREYLKKEGKIQYYKGNLFSGTIEYFYENGKLKQKEDYIDGKLDGEFIRNHTNGQLNASWAYTNGVRNGKSKSYYSNGQLNENMNYILGELDGIYEEYYDDGQLKENINYLLGERDGIYETYYPNGQLNTKIHFKLGKYDGVYEDYSSDGRLFKRQEYKDGERYGEWFLYGAKGGVIEHIDYTKGPDNYVEEEFWDLGNQTFSGKLRRRTVMRDGHYDGLQISVSTDGNTQKSYYENGKELYTLLENSDAKLIYKETYSYDKNGRKRIELITEY